MNKQDFQAKLQTCYFQSKVRTTNRFFKSNIRLSDSSDTSSVVKLFTQDFGDDTETWCITENGNLSFTKLSNINTSSTTSNVVVFKNLKNMIVSCCAFNVQNAIMYIGCKDGSVWHASKQQPGALPYSHDNCVVAIASAHSVLVSAGEDHVVTVFNLDKNIVMTTINSRNEICKMHVMATLQHCPVAVADEKGIVSVMSPYRSRKSGDIVQTCCTLGDAAVDLSDIVLFGRTCLIGLTAHTIQIWCLTTIVNNEEIISILSQPLYSLVRRITAPSGITFQNCSKTTGCSQKILTTCTNGNILIWDPLLSSVVGVLQGELSSTPKPVCYSPSTGVVMSYSNTRQSLEIFDTLSSNCVMKTQSLSALPISCSAVDDSEGIFLASTDSDGVLYVFAGKGNETWLRTKTQGHRITALEAISLHEIPGYGVVVTGNTNGCVETFVFSKDTPLSEIELGKASKQKLQPYPGLSKVTMIQKLSEDRILTGCDSGPVLLWKVALEGLNKLTSLSTPDGLRSAVNLESIGVTALGFESGSISLWNNINWTKITEVSDAHKRGVASIGGIVMADRNKVLITSIGTDRTVVKTWRYTQDSLRLEGSVPLPAECSQALLWGGGSSNYVFVQNTDGVVFATDLLNADHGPVRMYSTTVLRYWSVRGSTSPVVLTSGFKDISIISVWNNDMLHSQFFSNQLMEEFRTACMSSGGVTDLLDTLIKSHPSYPGVLMTSSLCTTIQQSMFAKAIIFKCPNFVSKYLSHLPLAVTVRSTFRGKSYSLLGIALLHDDMQSVDCILNIWSNLLTDDPSSTEECAWHPADLFDDIKLLSRKVPHKCADFLSHMKLAKAHEVCTREVSSRPLGKDEMWMRGAAMRVIPELWKTCVPEDGPAFPELESRYFEDGIMLTARLETPHIAHQSPYEQIFADSISVTHPTLALEHNNAIRIAQNEDWDENITSEKHEVTHSTMTIPNPITSFQPHIAVEGFCHPIPHAAAGSDFIRLCMRCCEYSGHHMLLSSPVVYTVLDFKWNTYTSKFHWNSIVHYVSLLLAFSMLNVYFDTLYSQPSETGLDILVWIVSLLLIVSYGTLMFQELLIICVNGMFHVFYQSMLFNIITYGMALCGLIIQIIPREDNSFHTSFTTRCVLSSASILLYSKLLLYLAPLPSIGPLVCRLFLSVRKSILYFVIILTALFGFALSFNLMHHRHMRDTTFDSFYGSFLQTMTFMVGGFDTTFGDDSDSYLFMSVFFIAFVFIVILILLVVLISVLSEAYNVSSTDGDAMWRLEQAKVIVLKDCIMSNRLHQLPFYNPKWLHILVPCVNSHRVKSTSRNNSGKNQSDNHDSKLRAEVAQLKKMVTELMDGEGGGFSQPVEKNIQTTVTSSIDEEKLAEKLISRLDKKFQEYMPFCKCKASVPTPTPISYTSTRESSTEMSPRPQIESPSKAQIVKFDIPPESQQKGNIILKPVRSSMKKLSRQAAGEDVDN